MRPTASRACSQLRAAHNMCRETSGNRMYAQTSSTSVSVKSRNTSRSVTMGRTGRNTAPTLAVRRNPERGGAVSAWIPALSVVLGGLIGVLGTLLGAYLQYNEAGKARREQYRREDKYRLLNERIDAYEKFYVSMGNARR